MADQVTPEGEASIYRRQAESGRSCTYPFCAACGATVFYTIEARPGKVSVPAGAFGHAAGFEPAASVHDHQRDPWLAIGPAGGLAMDHSTLGATLRAVLQSLVDHGGRDR